MSGRGAFLLDVCPGGVFALCLPGGLFCALSTWGAFLLDVCPEAIFARRLPGGVFARRLPGGLFCALSTWAAFSLFPGIRAVFPEIVRVGCLHTGVVFFQGGGELWFGPWQVDTGVFYLAEAGVGGFVPERAAALAHEHGVWADIVVVALAVPVEVGGVEVGVLRVEGLGRKFSSISFLSWCWRVSLRAAGYVDWLPPPKFDCAVLVRPLRGICLRLGWSGRLLSFPVQPGGEPDEHPPLRQPSVRSCVFHSARYRASRAWKRAARSASILSKCSTVPGDGWEGELHPSRARILGEFNAHETESGDVAVGDRWWSAAGIHEGVGGESGRGSLAYQVRRPLPVGHVRLFALDMEGCRSGGGSCCCPGSRPVPVRFRLCERRCPWAPAKARCPRAG